MHFIENVKDRKHAEKTAISHTGTHWNSTSSGAFQMGDLCEKCGSVYFQMKLTEKESPKEETRDGSDEYITRLQSSNIWRNYIDWNYR